MKHMKWSTIAKRGLAILLTIAMVLTVLPADGSAYAQSPDEDSEMSGSLSVLTEESEEPTTDTEESTENNMILGITTEAVTEDTEGDTGKDNAEDLSAEDGEEPSSDGAGNVTRGEWIHNLVTTFDMTVEDDEYPDNYFTDLDSSSEYYHDFLLAVEFGVLGDETGGEANVDAVATRGFAATTLNYCLGIQLDTTDYTFSDAADCTNPVDAQIAINQGWFTLVDGKFLPEQGITAEEMNAMLGNAGTLEASAEIEEGKKSNYTFADYVKVVPEGTQVTIDENKTVTITDLPVAISEGDTFAVYTEISPYLFVAQSIQKSGNITTITTSEADEDAAIVDADVEEMTDLDLELLEGVDDSEVTYIETEAQAEQMEAELTAMYADEMPADRVVTVRKDSVVVKKSIKVQDGASYNIAVTVDNIKVEKKLNSKTNNYVVAVSGRMTVVNSLTVDVIKGLGINNLILATVNIYGVNLTLSLNLSLGGALVSTYEANFRMGIQYTPSTKFRLISSFKKKKYTVVSEITASIGVKISANIDALLAYAELYAEAGLKAKFSRTEYDSGEPSTCVNFMAYMYVTVGAYARFGLKKYVNIEASKEYQIYNEKNTPFYISFHYEDGKQVQKCTRGNKYGTTTRRSTYLNQGSSRYGYSTYGNGGSYGMGEGGVLYPLYTYSLDENNNATITGYNNASSIVSIPKTIDGYTVTKIGYGAFKGKTGITVVTIPDTVTEIGDDAFYDCTNLVKVDIADSVTKIGSSTFQNCTKLSDVDLPKGLVELGYWSFANTAITSITIPKALEKCGEYTNYVWGSISGPFYECSNLKTVKFEKGVTRIAQYTFAGCEGIESVTIPDTVTEISYGAFYDCANLVKLDIADSVTKIRSCAFYNCIKLSDVDLPKSLVDLSGCSFAYTAITSITIPKALESSGCYNYDSSNGPFRGCSNLKTVKFEKGVTRIVGYTFAGCKGIESVTIPDTVTKIGGYAFYGCTNLVKVDIAGSVTEIYNYAFGNCTKLSDVDLPKGLVYLDGCSFANTAITSITIPKTLESIDCYNYRNSYGPFYKCSNLKTVKFEKGITQIAQYTFAGCDGIESVTIPDTVTKIRGYAFYDCTNLVKVDIADSVTEIYDDAFGNCVNLRAITIPKKVQVLGYYAFGGCTGMTKVTILSDKLTIGSYVFASCTSLPEITLPDCITTITSNMFAGCTSLKKVTYSDKVTEIKSEAFYKCTSLTSVSLNEGLTYIGDNAFEYCSSLKSVTLPNSLTSLGDYAFAYCDVLETVKIGSGITIIPSYAFYEDPALKSIVLPYQVQKVEAFAFGNCTILAKVYMNRNITSIADNAFSYPKKTTIYGVSGTYPETFADAKGFTFVNHEVHATKVTLSQSTIIMNQYEKQKLAMTVTPADFTDKVTWKSSNTGVVTVTEDGQIESVGTGTSTVKVSVGDVSATCKVTVVQPVTSLYITEYSVYMDALEQHQLKVNIYPDNAYNKKVAWSSSNPLVATVDANGLVEAKKKGTATITVTAQDGSNRKDTCTIYVQSDGHICKAVSEMESVHPYKNNTNEFWQYTVKNAKTLNVTFDARTEVEEEYDYLYIYDGKNNQIGKYTGKELAGKTLRITGDTVRIKLVSDDGGTAWGFKVTSVKANVTNVKVTKITLNKASANVERGKTLQLTATVTPTTATNKAVTWTSSNTKVATVSSTGKVTAKAVGVATITCTARDGSGVKATCKVTVKNPVVKVSKITLNKTSASLIKGDTLALKATVTPATATNKAVTWKSSNTKIATVSSSGKVTAKAAGTVTITCTAKDGSGKKATCRITVRAYTKTEAYVARIYTKALGRQPEAGGLKYWTGEINAKRKTPVEVAEQFFFAPEFTNKKLSNTEYVKVLYRTFMGREADKGGLDYWVGRLNKGESRKSVLEAFAGCPEFQKIVKSFGL